MKMSIINSVSQNATAFIWSVLYEFYWKSALSYTGKTGLKICCLYLNIWKQNFSIESGASLFMVFIGRPYMPYFSGAILGFSGIFSGTNTAKFWDTFLDIFQELNELENIFSFFIILVFNGKYILILFYKHLKLSSGLITLKYLDISLNPYKINIDW